VALELHPNDNARQATPSLWIFQGKSVVLLVIGAFAFVVIFQMLQRCFLDWWMCIPIALLPLGVMTLVVHFLVNGRPPSYILDVSSWGAWRFRTVLFKAGVLERNPSMWITARAPRHPNEFSAKETS
jgi:hypothetical protein